jgi:hypothetical protein
MQDSSSQAVIFACNPQALAEEEWRVHQAVAKQLFGGALHAVTELPDGYAFSFPVTQLQALAGFIDRERRCCPFLTFSLTIPAGGAEVLLNLTGAESAKAVIAAEFGLTTSVR